MSIAISNGSSAGPQNPGKYWERLTPVELELENPTKPEYPNKVRVFDDTETSGVVIVQFAARKVASFTFAGWDKLGELFSPEIIALVQTELKNRGV
jgi:hypothetical protein